MTQNPETERQEELVRYGYLLQWSMLVVPPMFFVSLIYLLFLRLRVTHFELRTHVRWQLATCVVSLSLLAAAVALFFIAMSGVHTDAPISVIATFMLMGAPTLFLAWLVYRLVYGNLRFSQQLPMQSMLP